MVDATTPTPTPPPSTNPLRATLTELHLHSWTTHSYGTPTTAKCMDGAVNFVVLGRTKELRGTRGRPTEKQERQLREVKGVLIEVVRRSVGVTGDLLRTPITAYNDYYAKGLGDVDRVLEEAAILWDERHGGNAS